MLFAIGDIHGESEKLHALLSHIYDLDHHPELVFLGDYIDKGQDASGVMTLLMDTAIRIPCRFLMGNHEYFWLNLHEKGEAARRFLERYGGKATAASLGCRGLARTREKLLQHHGDILLNLKPYYQNDQYLFVHSGIPAEKFTRSPEDLNLEDFLFNRYDFLSQPKAYGNRTVVFGHTAFFFPYVDTVKIGIDTAAAYSADQPLTAFCPASRFFLDSKGTLKKIEHFLPQTRCPAIYRG